MIHRSEGFVPFLLACGRILEYTVAHDLALMGPDRELYYNSPHDVPSEELRTEVQYPFVRAG